MPRPRHAAGVDDPRRAVPPTTTWRAARCCPGPRGSALAPAGAPLKRDFRKGFVYSDGWVDDARLVVLNALDASARATVLTRTACVDAPRGDGTGRPRCAPTRRPERTVNGRARWSTPPGPGRRVPRRACACARRSKSLRLVKGQPSSCRRCSSTSTPTSSRTPTSASSSPSLRGRVHADRHHRRRAPRAIGAARSTPTRSPTCARGGYFARGVRPPTWCGASPACARCSTTRSGDPSAVTRDYALELDTARGAAAQRVGRQDHYVPQARRGGGRPAGRAGEGRARAWTARSFLPGGDLSASDRRAFAPDPTSSASCGARAPLPNCPRRWCAATPRLRLARHRLLHSRAAPRWRRGCTRPSCSSCTTRNGQAAPTTCCGGAAAGPALRRTPPRRGGRLRRLGQLRRDRPRDGDDGLTLERIEQKVGAATHLYPTT